MKLNSFNSLRIFIIFLFIQTVVVSQEKLTLKEAVLQQYRAFYPKSLKGLSWLPNSHKYSYFTGWRSTDKYIQVNVDTTDTITLFTFDQLNAIASNELQYLPYLEWLNENEAYFIHNNKYYIVSISGTIGKIWFESSSEHQNHDIHSASKQVAYTENNNLKVIVNGKHIKVTDHKSEDIVSGQAIARQEFGITKGTFWSPQGSYLAFYEKDESNITSYPLVDITTTPATLNVIKYPMAGQQNEIPAVGVYNSNNQKLNYLKIETTWEDYFITNLSWTLDEKFITLALVNRAQDKMEFQVYDATNGKHVKTLFSEEHDKYVEPEHPAFFIEGTNNEFVWLSEKNGFMHMYHYTFNGKQKKQLTKGQFVVKEILGYNSKDKLFYILRTDETGLNTIVSSVTLKGKETILSHKEGRHTAQVSYDGKYILDNYSTKEIPRKIELITTKTKEKKELLKAPNPYSDYLTGQVEISSIKSADGKTDLVTRMIRPSDFDSTKKYPVLVYVYGGPHAQMISNQWGSGASLWMNQLAEEGFIVFTVDNRGSANRGRDFENVIHRQLGVEEMKDQMEGVKYLKSLSFVDSTKMAVHGWSFGGYMTISLMLHYPDVFKVGVGGGPVTDWSYYEIMYGERYMDTPKENPEGYQKTSLRNYVNVLDGDLLLIHGSIDDVVVPQHSLDLIKAFVEVGVQMDFYTYPMHPHNVRGRDRVHLMEKVIGYIKDKLGVN